MRSAALVLGAMLAVAPSTPSVAPGYVQEIEQWRAKREDGLRAPDGWLTVVGLTWLREGTSTIGSAKGSDIPLPPTAPPRVGTLEFSHGRAVIHVAPGVVVKAQDKPVAELELHSDKEGKPDVLAVGAVSLYVIERGGRHAVRVKDTEYRIGGRGRPGGKGPDDLVTVMAKRVGIEKRGDEFSLYVSLEGEPLHQFGPPIHLHIEGPFYVGIGFCSHLPDRSDTAVFSNVVMENAAGEVR